MQHVWASGALFLQCFLTFTECLQADVFSDYFRSTGLNVAYVEAKGAMFPVQTYYLEDILEVSA